MTPSKEDPDHCADGTFPESDGRRLAPDNLAPGNLAHTLEWAGQVSVSESIGQDCLSAAMIFLHAGRLDDALALLESAVVRWPEDRELASQLDKLRGFRSDPALGQNLLLNSLAQSPVISGITASAWNEAGLTSPDTNQSELAFHAAIQLDPSFDQPWMNLALLKLEAGNRVEAKELLERFLETRPFHSRGQYLLALTCQLNCELPRAVTMLENLVRSEPESDAAWELLRHCHVLECNTDRVIETSRQWLAARPDNPSAQYLLKSVDGEDIPDRACSRFVAESFDRIASLYDTVQASLGYQGPVSIGEVLEKMLDGSKPKLDVLDTGCGTGLVSPFLRTQARQLTGIDLSKGMLDQASHTGNYDRLECCDIVDHFAASTDSYDLIVAADVFCYFGDLEKLFPLALASLRPGGQMLFSLDPGQLDPDTWFIQPNGRYGHSPAYIVRVMGELGFPDGVMRRVKWRQENGKDFFALLIAIKRPGNGPVTD